MRLYLTSFCNNKVFIKIYFKQHLCQTEIWTLRNPTAGKSKLNEIESLKPVRLSTIRCLCIIVVTKFRMESWSKDFDFEVNKVYHGNVSFWFPEFSLTWRPYKKMLIIQRLLVPLFSTLPLPTYGVIKILISHVELRLFVQNIPKIILVWASWWIVYVDFFEISI